jgi:hypothetical protein
MICDIAKAALQNTQSLQGGNNRIRLFSFGERGTAKV